MAIVVIEEGAPNGTDLVVGEHNGNPLARAKAAGETIIKVADLGDDYGLAGVRLETAFDETREHLCVLLVVDAGLRSSIMGLRVVPTIIAELGKIKLADLKAGIAEALKPKPLVQAQ